MKYLKWFLISIFVFSGIVYSGMQGGWIESQIFENVTAEYIEITDSLATPKVKTDIITTIDSNATHFKDDVVIDSTLTVAKITADSGNIAEMWVATQKCDTVTQNLVYEINQFTVGAYSNQSADTIKYQHYGTLDADDGYYDIWWDVRVDSAVLDSIKIVDKWYNTTSADTNSCWLNLGETDIVENSLYLYRTHIDSFKVKGVDSLRNTYTWVIGKSWKELPHFRINMWIERLEGSSKYRWYYIIPYWTEFEKRYGVPE